MSPTNACLQWSRSEIQIRTRTNTSSPMKHNDCQSKHRSIAHSDFQMCCKHRRSSASQAPTLHNGPASFSSEFQRECKMKVHHEKQSNKLYANVQQNCSHNTSCRRSLTKCYCVVNNCVNYRSKRTKLLTDASVYEVNDCEPRSFKYHWRSLQHHFWLIVMIILINTTSFSLAATCATGLKTPGWTSPAGDITLEYGTPLRIRCMLNRTIIDQSFPGINSSDLIFVRNYKQMESEFITIIDDMTIEMFVEKPPPARDMYACKFQVNRGNIKEYEPVCINTVAIGHKPQEPKNFSCTSYNWDELKCNWEPVHNYVQTDFSLAFNLGGRAGRRRLFMCPPEDQIGKLPPVNSCTWTLGSNPPYRQPYEYYSFVLTGKNVLGSADFKYKFHHFGHMIPAKPENLTVVNKTTESAYLYWRLAHPLQSFPGGLHHRIAYQDQWDKAWKIKNMTNSTGSEHVYYNLTSLEYANTDYDVRVSIKSAAATGEDKWGGISAVTFKTLPKLPGLPPKTTIGSFEIVENSESKRDVYLYWQAIPPYLENGDNFKYQVTQVEENGRRLFIMPNETTRTYAKFKGISFNSYRFTLTSSNILGLNPENAVIYVPSQHERPPEPLVFTKIEFDDRVFELSWKPPLNSDGIVSYTVFWCDNDRDRPYQCNGYLDWVTVPSNTTIYNVTVPSSYKVYQFAISANTHNSSSGMVWATCTIIHNRFVGKMKSVWINRIGSDDIDVGWKLDCSDRIGVVEGFNIYYCPIVSPHNRTCKEPLQNKTIRADPNTIHGTVTGLKPYTTYMITVAVFTKTDEGLHSDALLNTTLEASPSTAPQNVGVGNVTNSTMFVSWKPPSAMNGVLRYYEVSYSGNLQQVEEATNVTLKNLLAYKNYSISVRACTVKCSIKSQPVYHLTGIGTPGKITKIPTVRFINATHMNISWSKPPNPGGNLNYYQMSTGNSEILNATKLDTVLLIPDCKAEGHGRIYKFCVRAVNINNYGQHLYGPWSDSGEINCYSDNARKGIELMTWVIGIFIAILVLLFIIFGSKRMWRRCRVMQDIKVVDIPPGLAPHEKLLQKGIGIGEQDARHFDAADSTNGSSASESGTASLTAESQISADSGTVIETDCVSQDKLIEPSSNWENSSLRQRNVGMSKPPMTDVSRWDSYVKIAIPSDSNLDETLSLARSTPNLTDDSGLMAPPQGWSSTGYISMASSDEIPNSNAPQEDANTKHYSVVGVLPKSRLKTDDLTESLEKSRLVCRADAKPYVSIGYLEQKLAGKLNPLDLTFVEQQPTKVEPLKPKSSTDQAAGKPYVQVGLMDNLKPFTPMFPSTVVPKSNISEATSKGYVTVDSITDSTNKVSKPAIQLLDGKVPHSQSQNTADKPYVQVNKLK